MILSVVSVLPVISFPSWCEKIDDDEHPRLSSTSIKDKNMGYIKQLIMDDC